MQLLLEELSLQLMLEKCSTKTKPREVGRVINCGRVISPTGFHPQPQHSSVCDPTMNQTAELSQTSSSCFFNLRAVVFAVSDL